MRDAVGTAKGVLEGTDISFEDLLILLSELERAGEFRLGREVAERVSPSRSGKQARALRERRVRFADQELDALLAGGPVSTASLEAPLAALGDETALTRRWWHVRRVVSKLRGAGRPRPDADLTHWKQRLEEAVRDLGARVVEQPTILPPEHFEALVKDLKGVLEFGLARTILEKARDLLPAARREWFWQQRALCTYKDEELIPRERFQAALEILDEIAETLPKESAETLALRGAVYKRMWEFGGQVENLCEAAKYCLQAWSQDPASDKGYGGVNAAYLMDVLASLEQPVVGGPIPSPVEGPGQAQRPDAGWSARARALREQLKREVPRLATPEDQREYWYRVTVAEIHWGLGEWDAAGEWLALAGRHDTSEWELQTTVKQLVSIARLRGVPPLTEERAEAEWHPAWRALGALTGEVTSSAVTCHRGKVGLALSGGGFRASLFHLGVLARLAEMDVLRSVEALSTVSGGSIVGAQYYLALQALLERHPDGEITSAQYVELVRRVQADFLAGVQNNLRTRGLANLICNLKFVLPGSYTRSNRMGELYEEYLYSRVNDGHPSGTPRRMADLLIHPCVKDPSGQLVQDRDFKPKFSNWRRRAKVPILLLNTTSLNTGHNWHFTARWMGEPPGLLGPEAETIPRYRRLWYHEAPTAELQAYRLGYAVAASACVPALFEPLELRGLYPGRTVRLVDGGVHDNQGVAGLLDESCTLILVSDASGQMSDIPRPSNGILGVPLRSNSILMDRVRESEYLDLRSRVDSHALRGLCFVHLKQELVQDPITWVGGKLPEYPPRRTTTSYGVDRDLQANLAAIRTDLDSFSEVEASALMASGYLITRREFERLHEEHVQQGRSGTWGDFDVHAPSRGPTYWEFLKIAPLLALPHDSSDRRRSDLGRQLQVGSASFLKAFKLCPELRAIGGALLVLIAAALTYLINQNWGEELMARATVGGLLLTLLIAAAGLTWSGFRLANPQAVMRSWAVKSALAVGGWLLANLHVRLIDPRFLKRGTLDRLMRLPTE